MLPPEVATLLYYAAILVARRRHGQRITQLDDNSLRSGVEWSLQQPWVDQRTKSLFQEGIGSIR
jgi:hypothetical protein